MSIFLLLIFASFSLVLLSLVLFSFSLNNADLTTSEYLSLLPLEDDRHGNPHHHL